MKTEMKMMPNGNYERVVCHLQHSCGDSDMQCSEFGWDMGKLQLYIEKGDPYENGFSFETTVAYCPFCGYKP